MDCLTEDEVLLYLQQSPSPAQQRELEEHLDSCGDCRGLVADLVQHAVLRPSRSRAPLPPGAAGLLQRGTMVDHYRIGRLLGRGGMGEVYLARDTSLGRDVALKLIRPEWAACEAALRRFVLEARTTARFSHPHIVAVYAVGEHQGLPYLALEYVAGPTLRQRMDEGPVSPGDAVHIALAIARALEESHRHGVLHGDLKPANVLLGSDGRPRVLDFGLSSSIGVDGTAPAAELSATAPTADAIEPPPSRSPGGTPRYMAPEQWGGQCGRASDVWALGVILHELVAGRPPFDESAPGSLGAAVLGPDPVPGLPPRQDVPAELSRLIAACLEKDPSRRPTVAAVVRVLGGLVGPGLALAGAEDACPFRGLRAYGEIDVDLFFGREAAVAAFLERLGETAVLPVVGPPGAGKSSFLAAGVLPRLREQGWRVLHLRPGRQPFETLARRLLPSTGGSPAAGAASAELLAAREQLASELRASPDRLGRLLQQRLLEDGGRLLIVVDQLEEVLDLETGRAFVRALCLAADDPEVGLRVIFALRADRLGEVTSIEEARRALQQATVLQPLDAAALKSALTRPLQAAGHTVDDPALVEEIIGAASGERACLALLQLCMRRLWERRDRVRRLVTRQSYEEMGGLAGALAEHAEEVLGGLSAEQGELARQLLLRLLRSRGAPLVQRGALLEGLGGAASEVLERLIGGRLVVACNGEGDVELAALRPSLLEGWTRLRRWRESEEEAQRPRPWRRGVLAVLALAILGLAALLLLLQRQPGVGAGLQAQPRSTLKMRPRISSILPTPSIRRSRPVF